MKAKIYTYKKCSTCRKAIKFLEANGIPYIEAAIRDTPPTKAELRKMLQFYGGDIKRLFNTSGSDYKALNMKEKLPKMMKQEAIDLLSSNGNLVKRPFLLVQNMGFAGFKEADWASGLL